MDAIELFGCAGGMAEPGIPPLLPWVTCAEALGHLSPEEIGRPVRLQMRPRTEAEREEDPEVDPRLAHPGHHAEGEHERERFPLQRSGGDAVVLSERAAAILQAFPETWVFCGRTKSARWKQIGQAFPPPVAEAVARQIVAALGD